MYYYDHTLHTTDGSHSAHKKLPKNIANDDIKNASLTQNKKHVNTFTYRAKRLVNFHI